MARRSHATAPVNPNSGTAGGILLVTELFPPAIGGSAELFANTYARLRTVRATVLTDARPSAEPQRRVFPGHVHDHRMRNGHWGLLHPSGLRNHVAMAARIRHLSRRGIRAVHCGRVLPEGLSALLAFAAGGPPYLCWVHGEELGYIDSSRELRWLACRVFRHARAVVANSANTADMLMHRGIRASSIDVVRPGVDIDHFRPDVSGAAELRHRLAPHGQILLLTVARLQRRKGHDLVLEALAGVTDVHRRVRYVIVGDGEERARLQALIRQFKLESVVTMEGRVGYDDLPKYFAAADMFIHPNRVEGRDFEGFGIVFLEAAACGIPVIAGRNGGVPEAVVGGDTGVLVDGRDAAELRDVLVALIDSPGTRREMGARARSRVVTEFTWQRAADQLSALHEDRFH